MIPILYEATETRFVSNGLGRLSAATSCFVKEERNGEYELEMQYPIAGPLFGELQESRIISAVPADGKERQPFRIYRITKGINGIAIINAEHISYQLSLVPVMPFTATTAPETVIKLKANATETIPFDLWTDITTEANYTQRIPKSFRACLGGSQGSFLDTYGGEFEWDNWTVKIHASRGLNKGVTIRYGKNLTDLEQEENIQDTYTGIVPYWYKEETETLVTLPEKVVMSDNADRFPFHRVLPHDFTGSFEQEPSAEALRTAAQNYVRNNNIGVPKVSLDVSFVALWQTDEYKDIANQERINLCDTVTVVFEELGVSATAKVIETEYNVLLDRYESIKIGEAKSSFADTFVKEQQETQVQIDAAKSEVQKAVEIATDLINNGFGGYVTLKPNADGDFEELLIMDTKDPETATKVWRWNLNGLGYSANGYNGPYTSAITMDGHIVADFVDTGTLNANIIKAGILSDANGNTTLNMTTGALSANKLSVSSPNFTLTESGIITAESAVLSNATINGKFVTDRAGVGRVEVDRGTVTIYSDQGTSSSGSNYVKCLDIAGSLAGGGACFLLNETIRFQEGLNSILDLYNEDGTSSSVLQSLPSYNAEKAVFGTGVYLERYYRQISSTQIETVGGHITMENDTGNGAVELYAGYWDDSTSAPILAIENGGGLYVSGTMSVDGSKHRLVETDSFGKVAMNAMESADCVFSDMGSSEIGEDGKVYIPFDPVFAETVNLNHEYQVFLTKTSDGVVDYVSKEHDSFSVIGEPGTTFDWIVYARQKGYVMERMERMSAVKAATKDDGQYYQPEDDGLEELASEYLENYEREVEPW